MYGVQQVILWNWQIWWICCMWNKFPSLLYDWFVVSFLQYKNMHYYVAKLPCLENIFSHSLCHSNDLIDLPLIFFFFFFFLHIYVCAVSLKFFQLNSFQVLRSSTAFFLKTLQTLSNSCLYLLNYWYKVQQFHSTFSLIMKHKQCKMHIL